MQTQMGDLLANLAIWSATGALQGRKYKDSASIDFPPLLTTRQIEKPFQRGGAWCAAQAQVETSQKPWEFKTARNNPSLRGRWGIPFLGPCSSLCWVIEVSSLLGPLSGPLAPGCVFVSIQEPSNWRLHLRNAKATPACAAESVGALGAPPEPQATRGGSSGQEASL